MPRAGGQYVYLAELYGPFWGFLYGWTLVLVIQTGTIAAVAVAFATYAGQLWPALAPSPLLALGTYESGAETGAVFTVSPVQLVAVGVILLLTALNARGLEGGRRVQNVFTVAEVGTLLAVIALGVVFGGGAARAANLARPTFATDLGARGTAMQLGAAMVGALFSADAWANVTFAAGEVRDARRTVPRALVLGTGLVCFLYLVTNVAYLNVLPLAGWPGALDTGRVGIGARALRTLRRSPRLRHRRRAPLLSAHGGRAPRARAAARRAAPGGGVSVAAGRVPRAGGRAGRRPARHQARLHVGQRRGGGERGAVLRAVAATV